LKSEVHAHLGNKTKEKGKRKGMKRGKERRICLDQNRLAGPGYPLPMNLKKKVTENGLED